MKTTLNRRNFLARSLYLPAAFSAGTLSLQGASRPKPSIKPRTPNLKLSCNLYSFNRPLTDGTMTLEEVFNFCADLGFAAVDPTAYYLPGYPVPPKDEVLYAVKQHAFRQGLDISGTGVRNDFTNPSPNTRNSSMQLVKNWVEAAAKLDAPVLRVFAGRDMPQGYQQEEVFDWIVKGLQECTNYGKRHGVMIILQHHNDVLYTAEEVLAVREAIDSDWFGIMVDIGSLRQSDDPYAEIARLAPHAYSWQIKEQVYRNGEAEPVDVKKLLGIIREAGYRGYLPLETLGPGDPKEKVARFLEEVRKEME